MLCLTLRTHLIKRTGVDSFLASDGRPYMERTWYSGPLKDYFIGSLNAFGIDHSVADKQSMPAVTPFVLYRRAVTDLIESLEQSKATTFEDLFLHGENVSEFGLYYAFFLANNINTEDAYWCDRPVGVTLWRQWAADSKKQIAILDRVKDKHVVSLGIHRNCINSLSSQAKEAVLHIWVDAGLFRDITEGAAFLSLLVDRI
jgi:hypothetical protein